MKFEYIIFEYTINDEKLNNWDKLWEQLYNVAKFLIKRYNIKYTSITVGTKFNPNRMSLRFNNKKQSLKK